MSLEILTTLDGFLWATGVFFWGVIGAVITWLLAEIVWGLACAVSLTSFVARMSRRAGQKVSTWQVFTGSLRRWWEMIGHVNSSENHYKWSEAPYYGTWRGVGDYTEN